MDEDKKNKAQKLYINNPISKRAERNETCLLFISVDMANSTSLKEKKDKWPSYIRNGLESLKKSVKEEELARFWKTVGDEIVFLRELNVSDFLSQDNGRLEIFNIFNRILTHVDRASQTVQLEVGGKGYPFKTTAWVAHLHALNYDDSPKKNLVYNVFSKFNVRKGKYEGLLGQDIDTGFRISKDAQSSVLTLSAELVAVICRFADKQADKCLSNRSNENDEGEILSKPYGCENCITGVGNIKFMDFRKYKGVWGGRHYPLFWYSPDWHQLRNEHELYYESVENRLVRKTRQNGFKQFKNCLTYSTIDKTEKTISEIFDDVGKSNKIERLYSAIIKNTNGRKQKFGPRP